MINKMEIVKCPNCKRIRAKRISGKRWDYFGIYFKPVNGVLKSFCSKCKEELTLPFSVEMELKNLLHGITS